MAEKSAEKKNVFVKIKDRCVTFFKGLKTEFKKVVWPTGKTLAKQTTVVVVISVVLCAFIRLVDIVGQYLVGLVSQIVK